ncbi:MAG: hypothetical protein C5B59_15890 [Bacteroidetes bacterium]|nr:MAG: hypothetical protein C5B59_15890 [Bacteroidota bacterium]
MTPDGRWKLEGKTQYIFTGSGRETLPDLAVTTACITCSPDKNKFKSQGKTRCPFIGRAKTGHQLKNFCIKKRDHKIPSSANEK